MYHWFPFDYKIFAQSDISALYLDGNDAFLSIIRITFMFEKVFKYHSIVDTMPLYQNYIWIHFTLLEHSKVNNFVYGCMFHMFCGSVTL